jgi:methylated-DNA-protein-cysteine methyltransferase related protein
MSHHGSQVAWHRVVRADGTPAPVVATRQLQLLAAEGVLPGSSGRLDLARLRWDGGSAA